MSGYRSAFRDFVAEIVQEDEAFLRQHGWLDPGTGGPRADLIEPLIRPFVGRQETPPPDEVQTAIYEAVRAGPALETLGNLTAALAWYRLGQYYWRGGRQFTGVTDLPANIMHRETAGDLQLEAAICADRAGECQRARDLYTWAAENRILTPAESDEFAKERDYQAFWEWLPYRAYALACLERWAEASEVAEEAQRWAAKDRRARTSESYQAPLKILAVLLALVRYKVGPSEETRRRAQEMLDPQAVASRSHGDHLSALFHLYNLRARHPELANPSPEALPPAARARQGYEACIEWMAHGGVHLDGSVDSLKLLDAHIRSIFPAGRDDEEKKTFLFLWGSYFGEVVQRELAGGTWNFSAKNLLAWTVDWDIGVVELHLWPFQHIWEYLKGETKKSLFQLWRETEQAYVDFGLAAKYAD